MNLDYFLLVCISSVGIYQITSIPADLKGLCFFPWPKVQYVFGALVTTGAFVWFFASENRNYQHTTEGAQQLYLFLLAIIAAYVFTVILSSIIQAKVGIHDGNTVKGKQHDIGVETLKNTTILGGILSSIRKTRQDAD